ncbi:MAG: hypothetical protein M3Q69_15900 [Acidobacteriota bacterium]|nr:hypothetical protein [Acidobacteriota bacterium]
MSHSNSEVDRLNFPEPTPEEVAALERAERANRLDSTAYLQFLSRITEGLPAPRETNSDSDEPFEL